MGMMRLYLALCASAVNQEYVSTIQDMQQMGLAKQFVDVQVEAEPSQGASLVELKQHIEMGGKDGKVGFSRPMWTTRKYRGANGGTFKKSAMCPKGTSYVAVDDPKFGVEFERQLNKAEAIGFKGLNRRSKASSKKLSNGGNFRTGASLFNYAICAPTCGDDGSCPHSLTEFDVDEAPASGEASSRQYEEMSMAAGGNDNLYQKTTFAEPSCVMASLSLEKTGNAPPTQTGPYCGLVCIPNECPVDSEARPHGVDGEQWGSCCPPDSSCITLPGKELVQNEEADQLHTRISGWGAQVIPVKVGLCMYRQSNWKTSAMSQGGSHKRPRPVNPYKMRPWDLKKEQALYRFKEGFSAGDPLGQHRIDYDFSSLSTAAPPEVATTETTDDVEATLAELRQAVPPSSN